MALTSLVDSDNADIFGRFDALEAARIAMGAAEIKIEIQLTALHAKMDAVYQSIDRGNRSERLIYEGMMSGVRKSLREICKVEIDRSSPEYKGLLRAFKGGV